MKLSKTFSKRYCFQQIALFLVVCFMFVVCHLFYNLSPSATLAGPKGKALGHSKLHGNSHSNLHSISVLNPINNNVNPAGIIVGTGGIRVNGTMPNTSNTGTVTNLSGFVVNGHGAGGAKTNQIGSNGYLVAGSGEKVLFVQPGSSVFVEIDSLVGNKIGIKVKNSGKIHTSGQVFVLAAGDAFSGAIADLGSLTSSLTVPEPIGAKGPNPVHAGRHPKKGDGNPGGGNGNGHWGEGNKGNGVGNIWTGNQGRGVGEGMAGGCRPDPDPEPEPEPEPEPVLEAAPLAKFELPRVEGCPALTQAAAMELGITPETLQVAIGNALALNPSIQPCDAFAKLVDYAATLSDVDGTRMAAMVQIFNDIAPADAPFTPEMATSIAMAFEEAAEGTQYASVMEYIDAFVQYVAVLDIELGSPVGDSVAFVMDKYGAGIAGSDNGNIAAFVATRLEAISK